MLEGSERRRWCTDTCSTYAYRRRPTCCMYVYEDRSVGTVWNAWSIIYVCVSLISRKKNKTWFACAYVLSPSRFTSLHAAIYATYHKERAKGSCMHLCALLVTLLWERVACIMHGDMHMHVSICPRKRPVAMRWNDDDDQINNWLLVIDLIFFPEESDHHHSHAMLCYALPIKL